MGKTNWNRLQRGIIPLFLALLAGPAIAAELLPGEAMIQWESPTENTDNIALPECPPDHVEGELASPTCLDGYFVYWGAESRVYPNMLQISDQSLREFVVSGIPAGNYFFSMTAYDSTGVVSESGWASEWSAS